MTLRDVVICPEGAIASDVVRSGAGASLFQGASAGSPATEMNFSFCKVSSPSKR